MRRFVQIFFTLLVAGIMLNRHLVTDGGAIPLLANASLHAICPFGGVESMYQYVIAGSYTRQIHDSSFILMYLVFGLTLLFGSVFCGWVCPLGSVQEWIGKLGNKVTGKSYNKFIPQRVDQVMRYLRYAVLLWVLYATGKSGFLAFKAIDPYYALFQFWTGEVAVTAFIVLGLTLAGSLVVERPWCKYLCPYGAVLGAVSKVRLFTLQRNKSTCIDCGACNKTCPMNIQITKVDAVRDAQCISCLQCTSEKACPIPNTLNLSVGMGAKEQPVSGGGK